MGSEMCIRDRFKATEFLQEEQFSIDVLKSSSISDRQGHSSETRAALNSTNLHRIRMAIKLSMGAGNIDTLINSVLKKHQRVQAATRESGESGPSKRPKKAAGLTTMVPVGDIPILDDGTPTTSTQDENPPVYVIAEEVQKND